MKKFDQSSEYRPVIGFEIHVELATKSKMFSSAPNNPDEKNPNTNIDEIITAQPGTLPVANKEAIRLAALVGLALNCRIEEWSKFDRKHYFYPDLPKGYQISQFDRPISSDGHLDILIGGKMKRVGITRAHLEEDAGKNVHPEGLNYSLVDFNRAGCPLLEIVTEPDIESGEEARVFLQELRSIIRYVGASDADMEKGTMRVEPNISVRRPGQNSLPEYKVEVKNINSFRFAEAAINFEIARQKEILQSGALPKQVTMGWNEKTGTTVEQRSKEEANDYRYFPEPDLPVLHFSREYIEGLRRDLPELPAQKRARFQEEYGLEPAVAENIVAWKELAYYFEQVVSELDQWLTQERGLSRQALIRLAANWCLQDFSALLNLAKIVPGAARVSAENFAELVKMIAQGDISGSAAKQIFKAMFDSGGDPSNIVQDLGLSQVSDEQVILAALRQVSDSNPKAVADYRAGQEKSFGFLVGQAMKELKGKGNPQVINRLLRELLNGS